MSEGHEPEERPLNLHGISTRWSAVHEPTQFALRYAPAIQRYLRVLVRDPHDAEEVAQEFLLWVTRNGFARASPDRGRFRRYLITAVRNAARAYYQRRQGRPQAVPLPAQLAEEADSGPDWLAEWQRCLLDRAWQALHQHERATAGSLAYAVLRLAVDHPDATSEEQAERLSAQAGRPFRADAYRQQLSRARRLFARMLLDEVAQTLDDPTPNDVEDELIETGLMPYVRPYLGG